MENKEYKVIISEGCTAFYTKIDEKLIEDMSESEKNNFIEHMLNKIKDGIKDNSISLESVINVFQYSDFETDSRSCDQCGDNVSRTTWYI